MVAGKIRQVPGCRSAAACKDRADVDQRAEVELGASERYRLQHPEEAARVHVAQRLRWKLPQILGPLRAFFENRDKGACAVTERLVTLLLLHSVPRGGAWLQLWLRLRESLQFHAIAEDAFAGRV